MISCNHYFKAVVVFAFFFAVACNNNIPAGSGQPVQSQRQAPSVTIKNLSWLAGKWQDTTSDGITYENWTIVNDSVMNGISGMIKGKDTTVYETIALQLQRDGLFYIPTVKDQNEGKPVPFKLTQAVGDSFVFENPQHDFPDKITYTKISAAALLAKISGKINGQYHAELFPMARVE